MEQPEIRSDKKEDEALERKVRTVEEVTLGGGTIDFYDCDGVIYWARA